MARIAPSHGGSGGSNPPLDADHPNEFAAGAPLVSEYGENAVRWQSRSWEDVTLQSELAHLTPQPDQFLALCVGRDATARLAAPLAAIGLGNQVADQLPSGLELVSQILWIRARTNSII